MDNQLNQIDCPRNSNTTANCKSATFRNTESEECPNGEEFGNWVKLKNLEIYFVLEHVGKAKGRIS